MAAPTRDEATTTQQLVIDWIAPSTDGSSPIVSYNLQWDQGTQGTQWASVVGSTIDTLIYTFAITTNVYAGDWYQVRVRAKNVWGWGDLSPVLLIKAATKPSKMASPPTTTIDPATGGILITWLPPATNSEAITKYKVEIINKAGVAVEEVEYCDGTSQTIVSNLRCVVPMAKLRSSYLLAYPDIMKVQVSAFNLYGWGPVSNTNTVGATVFDVPVQMAAPTRGAETQTTTIQVNWTPLTLIDSIRALTVLSYNLQWDEGTNGVTWTNLVGFSIDTRQTTFTAVTGITGGSVYKFRVRAKNLYGWGDFSQEVAITASQQPDPVATITTENDGTDVVIRWSAPINNFAVITSYSLQVLETDGKTYADANTYCDEDADAILSARKCTISLTELRAAPFSLTYNQVIVARVRSVNMYGTSDYSQPNVLGATIRTEPQ